MMIMNIKTQSYRKELLPEACLKRYEEPGKLKLSTNCINNKIYLQKNTQKNRRKPIFYLLLSLKNLSAIRTDS
jgi:hypothetical protein